MLSAEAAPVLAGVWVRGGAAVGGRMLSAEAAPVLAGVRRRGQGAARGRSVSADARVARGAVWEFGPTGAGDDSSSVRGGVAPLSADSGRANQANRGAASAGRRKVAARSVGGDARRAGGGANAHQIAVSNVRRAAGRLSYPRMG
jgi:hypothetical protein